MVQAIVNISEKANKTLNILKAKHSLRTKSEAINLMAEHYEQEILEPELRSEYIKKIREIEKNAKWIRYSSIEELNKDLERLHRRRQVKENPR